MELLINKKKPIMALIYGFFSFIVFLQLYITIVEEREIKIFYVLILGDLGLLLSLLMIQNMIHIERIILTEKQITILKKIALFPIKKQIKLSRIQKTKVIIHKNETREIQLQLRDKKYLTTLTSGLSKEENQQIIQFLKKNR